MKITLTSLPQILRNLFANTLLQTFFFLILLIILLYQFKKYILKLITIMLFNPLLKRIQARLTSLKKFIRITERFYLRLLMEQISLFNFLLIQPQMILPFLTILKKLYQLTKKWRIALMRQKWSKYINKVILRKQMEEQLHNRKIYHHLIA